MSSPESDVHDSPAPVPIDPIVPLFREWAMLKAEADALTTRRNKLRDRCAAAVAERGYADHKGSQYLDLPWPIEAGGVSYLRIKRERRVTTVPDAEVAESVTRSKGDEIYRRVFPLVPCLDPDELYVLLQEGVLTEDDMDAIFVQHESFAFKGMAT
jgi:hypothetical protein